jgi:type II secretory pathway component PulF
LATGWERHPVISVLRLRRRLAFARQMLAVVKSGLPLASSFEDLGRATGRSSVFRRVSQSLRDGRSLGEALQPLGEFVDPLTRALLSGAEQTGRLEHGLTSRVQQLEEIKRGVGRLLAVSIYPLYLVAGLVFVGPLLSLPGSLSGGACAGSMGQLYVRGLVQNVALLVGAISALFCAPLLSALLGTETIADRLLLRLPLWGRLYQSLYSARLAAALGSGLAAGLDVRRVLQLGAQAMSSPSRSPLVVGAVDRLDRGESLASALGAFALLDMETMGQVAIGERTGTLEDAFVQISTDQWESVVSRARVAAFMVLGLVVAGALASAVIKMLGVILGTVNQAYSFPEKL